jgi:hypothetical protein
MPRRPQRRRRTGIGPTYIGGAAGSLGFAVAYALTVWIPVSLVVGVVVGLVAVVWLPVRRRRRARAARQ